MMDAPIDQNIDYNTGKQETDDSNQHEISIPDFHSSQSSPDNKSDNVTTETDQEDSHKQTVRSEPAAPTDTNTRSNEQHSEAVQPRKLMLKEVQNGGNMTVEEFLSELVHAYPRLDLRCLTKKDICTMMKHEMVLDKEKFGLVPLAEYEATRKPKPQPKPVVYGGNSGYHQHMNAQVKNSAMASQQNPYANMQQDYVATTPAAQTATVPQAAGHVGGIDPAVLSSWYSEMLRSGYPAEQLQAYFSDMLVKMSQGQNPLIQQAQQLAAQQQQQQQQHAQQQAQQQQQQQWASTTYTTNTASPNAAAMSFAQSQNDTFSGAYNHKSASAYDARMASMGQQGQQDSYESAAAAAVAVAQQQKLASMQQWRNEAATSAAAAVALYQQQLQAATSGYSQQSGPVDMSAWQGASAADLSMQYGAAEDSQGSSNQGHQGYM